MVTIDIRQIMGAILTISMFLMLGNMIKRDHFDADVLIEVPVTSTVQPNYDQSTTTRHSLFQLRNGASRKNGGRLKLCWNNSSPRKGSEQSKGFVTFSLTDGPEYHISQVANAVLLAKHLGATLVPPEIIGSNGEKRGFEEIYDYEKFVTAMSGVVQVERRKQTEASTQKLTSVKVPYMASQNYITTNIEPLFRTSRNLRVITYFPSSTMSEGKVDKVMSPYSCWATFEALRLNPELQKVVDSVVGRLRGHDSHGQFVAIDYKGEMLGTSACRGNTNDGMKDCYKPAEITQFLTKIGYIHETVIYVTQSKPDHTLRPLKDSFPKTFTKDDIMEESEKGKYLNSKSSELERDIIDFYVCSVSDVFVPAKSGLFYANVVGNRIASSKIDVFVPAQISSTLAQDHVTSYIAKGSHPAISCFCQ